MSKITQLKSLWANIYDPQKNAINIIDEYFHPDYEQCINGLVMTLEEYRQHVMEQRKNITDVEIKYDHILEKDNELFALYYVDGKNQDGSPIEAEVIAYYQFKNLKVYRIHGQVRLIKGDYVDVDTVDLNHR